MASCRVVGKFRKKKNARKFAQTRRNKGLKARLVKTAKGYAVQSC